MKNISKKATTKHLQMQFASMLDKMLLAMNQRPQVQKSMVLLEVFELNVHYFVPFEKIESFLNKKQGKKN